MGADEKDYKYFKVTGIKRNGILNLLAVRLHNTMRVEAPGIATEILFVGPPAKRL